MTGGRRAELFVKKMSRLAEADRVLATDWK